MNFKPILIVPGEPKSIFFEIFFKSLKLTKIKSPLIIICNKKILLKEIKKFNFSKKIEELNKVKIDRKNIKEKKFILLIFLITIQIFTLKNVLNLLSHC